MILDRFEPLKVNLHKLPYINVHFLQSLEYNFDSSVLLHFAAAALIPPLNLLNRQIIHVGCLLLEKGLRVVFISDRYLLLEGRLWPSLLSIPALVIDRYLLLEKGEFVGLPGTSSVDLMLFAAAGERIVKTEPEQGKLMCLEPNLPVFVLSFVSRQFGDVVLLQNFCVELYYSKERRDKSGHFDDEDDESGRLS